MKDPFSPTPPTERSTSPIEDFVHAPVESTATHKTTGTRAIKVFDDCWILSNGIYVDDSEMGGYAVDRLDPSAPATAGEALDLAWDLAHEAKPGQTVPRGTRYLELHRSGVKVYSAMFDFEVIPKAPALRTVEPLPEPEPEPEPDWLDAPAVLAPCGCRGTELWHPSNKKDDTWECTHCGFDCHWSYLRGVTPLYPLAEGTLNGTTAPKGYTPSNSKNEETQA